MPVNFFNPSCENANGMCLQLNHSCLIDFNWAAFGVSDANSNARVPAQLVPQGVPNDFEIQNNGRTIQFKAVDYCIDIFRTGNYDLDDDNRDPAQFSSDNVRIPGVPNELIKRCEGFFVYENNILFFEIKTGLSGSWLKDAREKFEETILSFRQYHSHLNLNVLPPIIANKNYPPIRVHQNEGVQQRILRDKIQLQFILQPFLNIP